MLKNLGIATLVVIAGFGGAMLIFATDAWPHEAMKTAGQPLGWAYGWECCSARDCFKAIDSDIAETKPGYRVNSTGEVIGYADKRIKRSRDEFYHRCTPGGDVAAKPLICLYVPDRGF